MREDRFTNTPEDAARYESRRGQADDVDDRPTLLEAQRDEADDQEIDCISEFGPHGDHTHCEWMLAHPTRPFTIETKAVMPYNAFQGNP